MTPVALLLCRKPMQAVLNFFLRLPLWVPGAVHAVLVVHEYHADKRQERLIRAMSR